MSEQKSFPLTRLRLLSAVIRRGISPTYADFGTPVASQKCVRPHGKFNVSHARNHDTDTRAIYPENFVQPGDALINSTGTGTLGRSTVISSIDSPLTWDSHITLVRPRRDLLDSRFLAYVLQNSENRFITLSQGSTNQIELSRDTVSNLPIPAIDLPTQRRIADYLDRETAQIDAMSGALDGLVARLEERRGAAITSAVCGDVRQGTGMGTEIQDSISPDANTPLPSAQLRHYAEINPPTSEFASLKPGAPLTFMSLDMVWPDGHADVTSEAMWTGQHHSYTPFRRGDVLLPKVSPTFTMGRAAVVNSPHPLGLASSEVFVLRARKNADPRFIAYAVRTTHFLAEGTASQQGVGGLRRVSSGWVGSFNFPQYDLPTQRRIADHLDAETAKIDAMITKAGELRALLDERRSALITATVTGQHPVPEEP